MEQICENIVSNIFRKSAHSEVFEHLAIDVVGYEEVNGRIVLMDIHPGDLRLILVLMLAHENCISIAAAIMMSINAIDGLYPDGAPCDDEHPRKIKGIKDAGSIGDQIVVILEDNATTASEPVSKTDIPLLTNADSPDTYDHVHRIEYDYIIDELNQIKRDQRLANNKIMYLAFSTILAVAAYTLGELIGTMLY